MALLLAKGKSRHLATGQGCEGGIGAVSQFATTLPYDVGEVSHSSGFQFFSVLSDTLWSSLLLSWQRV